NAPALPFTSYCVTTPGDARLPDGGGNQICGFMDQNPNSFATSPFYVVQRASTFGDVSDVYTGYDFNANARLPRGGFVSGGASIGHEITDICQLAGRALVGHAPSAALLAATAGTLLPFGSTAVAGGATTPSSL